MSMLVGDVSGPSSATNNALARFDGATGKLIQNSAVTVDDAGNVNANSFNFPGSAPSVYQVFTATSGQTVFNLTQTYSVGDNSLWVFLDGVRQVVNQDYTETDSDTITFSSGLTSGSQVVMLQMGAFGGKPNLNLLINTNLYNPINQRGVTASTVLATTDYTVDRWFVNFNGTGTNFDCDPTTYDGTRYIVTAAGTSQTIAQVAQKVENYADYASRAVTLTMRYKCNSGASGVIGIYDGTTASEAALTCDGAWHELSKTATVGASPTELRAYIKLTSPSTNDYVEIAWAKLEDGSAATQWSIPEPVTELARCQRYYWATQNSNYELGVARTSSYTHRGCMPFPVTMRSTPSISGTFSAGTGSNGVMGTYANGPDSVALRNSSDNWTLSTFIYVTSFAADAEL